MASGGFFGDLRFALRQLVSKPGFAAVAIVTLALGIGANTAVFSMLNGYFLKPLPYPQGQRLVSLNIRLPKFYRNDDLSVSIPMYEAIRKHVDALSGVVAAYYDPLSLQVDGHGRYTFGIGITGNMARALGVQPILGRALTPADNRPGHDHVAVISYRLWKSRFNATPKIVGHPIRLNGKLYTVVGVMPRGFMFPSGLTKVWVPNTIDAAEKSAANPFESWLGTFVGRLKPGANITTLKAQLAYVRTQLSNGLSPKLKKKYGDSGFHFVVRSFRQYKLANGGGHKPLELVTLQAAVLLLLLITCVNVANLLLTRILGRGHEIAMRRTLGATRRILVRQLLVEGLCLAIPGGLAGLALGWLCVHLITGSPLNPAYSLFNISLDWRVALFVFSAACLVGMVVSVLPALHLSKADLKGLLQEGGRAASGGRAARRTRNALAIVQISLATALLAGAGLLLHSFVNLDHADVGFNPDHLMALRLLGSRRDNSGQGAGLRKEILHRVQALPGVESAAMASWIPLNDYFGATAFKLQNHKPLADPKPRLLYDAVTPQFFKTLGIPVVEGRGFTAEDTKTSQLVAVVDSRFAKRFFGKENPVGHYINLYQPSDGKWVRIVGVTPPIRLESLKGKPPHEIYLDDSQLRYNYGQGMRLVLRTRLPASDLIRSIKHTIAQIAPSIAVYSGNLHTYGMRGILAWRLRQRQTFMLVVLVFGVMALALAAIGLYGVLSHAMAQRRNEFGIRLALGAVPGHLERLALKDGLTLLGIGLAIGLTLAVVAGQVLDSMLFHVAPYDPLTLAVTVAVLGLTTLLACYLPARRAARLNPFEVLSGE